MQNKPACSKFVSNLVKMEAEIELLKFPIGAWKKPINIQTIHIEKWIKEIKAFPLQLANTVARLTPEMLAKSYRPAGWTGRQIVHHCADSHMNALIRFKLALTEDEPTIKPYDQDKWVMLADYQEDVQLSLDLLKGIHAKWGFLMDNMEESDWEKNYVHPEYGARYSLATVASQYAWHGQHHMAHLELILKG